jgi:hypothetical protein
VTRSLGEILSQEKSKALHVSSKGGWNKVGMNAVWFMEGEKAESSNVPASSSRERSHSVRAFALQRPIIISQDNARQGATGQQVLYVLGFGIAGAILATMTVFIYFIPFHARQAESTVLCQV